MTSRRFTYGRLMVVLYMCAAVFIFEATTISGDVAADSQLMLVDTGQPVSTLIIPDNADEWTRMAADWVSQYMEKLTGAKMPV